MIVNLYKRKHISTTKETIEHKENNEGYFSGLMRLQSLN